MAYIRHHNTFTHGTSIVWCHLHGRRWDIESGTTFGAHIFEESVSAWVVSECHFHGENDLLSSKFPLDDCNLLKDGSCQFQDSVYAIWRLILISLDLIGPPGSGPNVILLYLHKFLDFPQSIICIMQAWCSGHARLRITRNHWVLKSVKIVAFTPWQSITCRNVSLIFPSSSERWPFY